MKGIRLGAAASIIGLTLAPIASEQPLRAQSTAGIWPNPRECSNINPGIERECIGRRVESKERTLERLYTQALAAVREGFAKWGRGDMRMNPRYFVQAHRDWQRFVKSNCTALAAFGGGSNSSISDRETECRERELDQRIALYRQLADGTYGL